MTGLRAYERDLELASRLSDTGLSPPTSESILEWIEEHLSARAEPVARSARLEYARWKPFNSITTSWSVAFDDGASEIVTCKQYALGKAENIASVFHVRRRKTGAGTRLAPFAHVRDAGAVLWCFPADRILQGLERIVDKRRIARMVHASGSVGSWRVRRRKSNVRLLRYKPERRAVFELDLGLRRGEAKSQFTLAARVLPAYEALHVAGRRRMYARVGDVAGPTLVHHDPESGVLLETWLAGEPLAPDDFSSAERAGATLAAWHRPCPGSRSRSIEPLRSARELLELEPELAAGIESIGPRIVVAPTVWIHGDFHPDQLVEGPGRELGVLDLDAVRPGEPEEDLASWMADELMLRSARSGPVQTRVDALEACRALIDGYRGAGGSVREARLLEWTAVELARRAAGALRRLERDGLEKARLGVELATAAARAGGVSC
ncbi:MAG: phosphotransferase [bacterium]|nr:phosphotransferase [bacterium]